PGREPRRRDRGLSRGDRPSAAAAQMGLRLLAEPRALPQRGRAAGRGAGVPAAPLSARRDRPGLAVLARQAVGPARFLTRALSRPESHGGRGAPPERARADLGVA